MKPCVEFILCSKWDQGVRAFLRSNVLLSGVILLLGALQRAHEKARYVYANTNASPKVQTRPDLESTSPRRVIAHFLPCMYE
jgi:hypothetical protein